MEEKGKKRRIHYFVNRSFQTKHVGTIFLLMGLVTVVFALTVYYSGWIPLTERLSAVYPQGRLVAILRVLKLQLTIRLLLLVPIILIVSVYLSHKMVGPLARLEKNIRAISKGNLQMRLRVRRRDVLQGLAQVINEMVENVEQMLSKNKNLAKEVSASIKDLQISVEKLPEVPDEIREKVVKLNKEISTLCKISD